jgi:peptidoglycan hydrolase-like protein with peptidoglycan-binding domain
MTGHRIFAILFTAALAASPAPRAAADGADAFVGGLLGGAIGSAISNSVQQRQQQQRVYVQPRATARAPRAPSVSSAQREDNRRVQTALNYFGFPAGVPDGVMGRNSRAAVANYQVFVGLPATGVLSEYDRAFLLTSYDRAIVGGPQAAQIMAQSGQGPRGLLGAYRQEALGIPVQPVVPGTQVVTVVPQAPVAAVPQAPAPAVPQAPEVVEAMVQEAAPAPAKGPGGLLPSFLPETAGASIAGYCNRVSIDSSANQGSYGLIDAALDGFDAEQALAEQFCLARSYGIDQGESLVATVQGFTPAEMQEQCEAFAPTMRPYIMQLASEAPAAVGTSLRGFLDGTGVAPTQMSGTGRICLGIGYMTDNAELALGSALVLVALGEQPYAELVGFQLREGFGVPQRRDRGPEWLGLAVDALDGGAAPLVADPDGERVGLLAVSLDTLSGHGQGAALGARPVVKTAAPTSGFGLPQAPVAASN